MRRPLFCGQWGILTTVYFHSLDLGAIHKEKMCFKCINTYILFLFYFNSNIGRLCDEMYLHTMCIESTNKIYFYKDKKQRHESILKAHIFMHISFYLDE